MRVSYEVLRPASLASLSKRREAVQGAEAEMIGMSLRQQPWWPKFLEDLQQRPLQELAIEWDIDLSRALGEVLASGMEGRVEDQPWWPEALRVIDAFGVREAARRFATNPRRLRRGLARAGLRVAGKPVDEGVPQLEPFRDQLGRQSDQDLAQAAGVTVEAVKGERRRLGIKAYRPPPRAVESVPDTQAVPAQPVETPKPDPAPRPKRRIVRTGEGIARRTRSRADDRVHTWSRDDDDSPATKSMVLPKITPKGAAKAASAAPPAPSKADEAMMKRRRGRTRIIRRDHIEVVEPEPAPPPKRRYRRKSKTSPHGEVREVSVAEVDLAEILSDAEDAPRAVVEPVAEAAAPEAPAAEPDAVEPVAAEPVAAKPVAAKPVAAEPVAAGPVAAEPAAVKPAAVEPAAPVAKAVETLPPPAPAKAPQVEHVPADAETAEAGEARQLSLLTAAAAAPVDGELWGWQLVVDGAALPVLLVAADVASALAQASRQLGPSRLARASIQRIGPSL